MEIIIKVMNGERGIYVPQTGNGTIVLTYEQTQDLIRSLLEAAGGYVMPGHSLVMGWK